MAEDVASVAPKSTWVPARPARQKTPQDWGKLAAELGIELPPEPEPAPVETVVSTPVELPESQPIVFTTLEADVGEASIEGE
ncbi:MAG: hypothetical protein NUV77_21265, partial [Thermoguttaceae bacterium]|nr:hypothetical protein [Thermoguttaceae bacterium]